MAKTPAPSATNLAHGGETRRDFLYLATGVVGAVGVAASVWPFIHQMNPSASVLALASTDVDLSRIEEGQSITVLWRGKPVFVRHRTPSEITEAEDADFNSLPDPQSDMERVKRREWLILVGVCTHLGCVPLSHR
ncbi:MAG TPA: ubiquinol-cytochrome c reductase iron-sulfur subunit, partial [Alphaproteobacteria bacterium]|nr:ubiquinol-cytochrome c reductase iron-sulfur subunit [Alphaproteobacteria bacterium]